MPQRFQRAEEVFAGKLWPRSSCGSGTEGRQAVVDRDASEIQGRRSGRTADDGWPVHHALSRPSRAMIPTHALHGRAMIRGDFLGACRRLDRAPAARQSLPAKTSSARWKRCGISPSGAGAARLYAMPFTYADSRPPIEHAVVAREFARAALEGGGMGLGPIARYRSREMDGIASPGPRAGGSKTEVGRCP